VLDHKTTVLHHLDTHLCQALSRLVVSYPGLEPDRLGFFGHNILYTRLDVLRSAEHIDKIYFARDINEPAIHLLAKNLGRLRIVDGNRNNIESCVVEILRHLQRRLIRLTLPLYAQDRNPSGAQNYVTNFCGTFDQVILPIHAATLTRIGSLIDVDRTSPE